MATKINITQYVDGLLGRSNTTIGDQIILAGMEDVLSKIIRFLPEAINDFVAEIPITASPFTVQYLLPQPEVYVDNMLMTLVPIKQHAKYAGSLFNSRGFIGEYYIMGNKIYIDSFDSSRSYTLLGVSYGVSSGVLTWADKQIYPLALHCAASIMFKEFSTELENIITSLGRDVSASIDYSRALVRLANDDVELAGAELTKIRTQIEQYAAMVANEQGASEKARQRVENASGLFLRYQALKASYAEYFGLSTQPKEGDK